MGRTEAALRFVARQENTAKLCDQACGRPAAPGRKRCETCRSRIRAERYPIRTAYGQLRRNAKRRGVDFLLTFEYWEKFCRRTKYIELRGVEGKSLTVDRIKEYDDKGYPAPYADWNIQVLTKSKNAKKSIEERRKLKKKPRKRFKPGLGKQPGDPF